MKILYLTTSLLDEDYARLIKEGKPLNNPSNQNFHSRLISILKDVGDLHIVRIITAPVETTVLTKKEGESYLPYESSRLKKYIVSNAWLSSLPDVDIVIYDSLSMRASIIAKKYAKKHKIPSISVVTDNPKNLSKTSFFFQKAFLSSVKKSQGYITVNPGILESLGIKTNIYSSLGFLDDEKEYPIMHNKPYFYFGGSLLPRYGINALVSAFEKTNASYDLLIAGHHNVSISSNDPRIHFLGLVDKESNLAYEKGASLLINPRPYEEKIDKESTPSKMLEYLSSGQDILSTKSTILMKEYPDDVNWIEGKNVEKEIGEFFVRHLDKGGLLFDIKKNEAKEKVYAKYGKKAQAEALEIFLQEIISSSNKSMTF